MKNQVIVSANPSTGLVFTANEKPGKDGKPYGFIVVKSTACENKNGFLVVKTRTAIVPMSKAAFDAAPLMNGEALDGKIIVLESLERKPGYQPKLAGDGGTPCTLGGRQIYRTTKWVTDESSDELLKHDNVIVASSAKPAAKKEALNG